MSSNSNFIPMFQVPSDIEEDEDFEGDLGALLRVLLAIGLILSLPF